MQIGIVAKKIGLSVDAIRFYERNGLIPQPPRTGGGFRQYAENDVETLTLSAACRVWDSSSVRSADFCDCEGIVCSHVRRCSAGCRKSWPTYSGNLRIFTSWSMNFIWLCAAARKRCANSTLIVQF